jgi:hypothetical protein
MMKREQSGYLSYLVRLWRVGRQDYSGSTAEQVVWRASLESPHTHERWCFASLDDLFDFLRAQTDHQSHKAEGVEQRVSVHSGNE